jgi:hypothetical protein
MALIDNVTASRVRSHAAMSGSSFVTPSLPGIDWDDVLEPIIATAKKALAQEIWEWLDANPDKTIFRIKVKVWVLPINWSVKSKDAAKFVEFLLGPRPY